MDDKSLAERIIAARTQLGWSQKQAATRWRVNRRTLEAWEEGRYKPDKRYRAQLEQILARLEKK
jgi:ribosome-binding protein aMBF1 (putative translation factor)